MTVRCLWITVLVAVGVHASPVMAANQIVAANSSNQFAPAAVTVLQGESVTWINTGGSHNVHFDDNSFDQPALPQLPPWDVPRTFGSAGTFRYYCEAHGGPGGQGMSGTVAVQSAGTTDSTAPALKLSGAVNQRVLRRRAIFVRAEVDEASRLVASGTISVPGTNKRFRLRKASRQLKPGVKANLKLGLSKQVSKALRRALTKDRRLTAKLTVTARDPAGNVRLVKRKITLKK